MDTFVVVVVVGAIIFMIYNLIKYAKFIHNLQKEKPDSSKKDEEGGSSIVDSKKPAEKE
ncbi:MAG: hypothetical protein ACE5EK_09100 [Nitrospinales bacterium]